MNDGITNPQEESARAMLASWLNESELLELRITEITGGLSGARFWKIALREQLFCLRCDKSVQLAKSKELRKIYPLIEFVDRQGFSQVPLPRQTLAGETFVEMPGSVWELARWLPGEAIKNPTHKQALAATKALAQFHIIAAQYERHPAAIAPGLKQRLEKFTELHAGLLAKVSAAVKQTQPSELRTLAGLVLSQVESTLPEAINSVQASQQIVPMQWCLCDCHLGNFLFVGDQVSGMLDFQTAGVGSVARDLARLLGSMTAQNAGLWRECLTVYQQLRQLSSEELPLVYTFHMSGTVGAAANWLRWRFLDDLPVADAATTQTRLSELSMRMATLRDCKQAISSLLGPIS